MPNKLTKTFTAAVSARAIAGNKVAEARVDAVTDISRRGWLAIKDVIKARGSRAEVTARVQTILRTMTAATEAAIEPVLMKWAEDSFNSAFDIWEEHLPAEYWGRELVEAKPRSKTKTKGKFPKTKPKPAKNRVSKKLAERVKLKIKPKKSKTLKMVRSRGWKSRMRKWSKKITDLDRVADLIAKGIEKGKSFEQIVNTVRPHVDAYASSTRRLVRTELARIENKQLEKTYEAFGDLIIGFQILNPCDERTRAHHLTRAGRIYWKDRRKKYKAEERPELPDEPNCRCCYGPVFKGETPPQQFVQLKLPIKGKIDKPSPAGKGKPEKVKAKPKTTKKKKGKRK